MTTIGIRELKARASEILRDVRQGRKEFLITSHGRPCAKLVPVAEAEVGAGPERKSLRAAYADLPKLDDRDFGELKIWDRGSA